VEAEAPAVIAAAQSGALPFLFDDERAAMGARVRQQMQGAGFVACESERLVEHTGKQRERAHVLRSPPSSARTRTGRDRAPPAEWWHGECRDGRREASKIDSPRAPPSVR